MLLSGQLVTGMCSLVPYNCSCQAQITAECNFYSISIQTFCLKKMQKCSMLCPWGLAYPVGLTVNDQQHFHELPISAQCCCYIDTSPLIQNGNYCVGSYKGIKQLIYASYLFFSKYIWSLISLCTLSLADVLIMVNFFFHLFFSNLQLSSVICANIIDLFVSVLLQSHAFLIAHIITRNSFGVVSIKCHYGQEALSLLSLKTQPLEFLFSAVFHLYCNRFSKIHVKHCLQNLGLLIL